MTEHKPKTLNYILILLPILDVLTSLSARFFETSITIGIIVKGLMIFYFSFYILFLTNSKFKNLARGVLFLSLSYVIFYFLSKLQLLSSAYFFGEAAYLLKMLFLPIIFSGFLCFYDDMGFNLKKMNKILLINILLYTILLLLPFFTNTAFETYKDGSLGFIGWYYSGNEISAILILLFPFLYLLFKYNKIIALIMIGLTAFATSLVGTKVAMLGNIIVGAILLFVILFKKQSPSKWKTFIFSVFALLLICFIMFDSYAVKNMNRIIESEDKHITETIPNPEEVIKPDEKINPLIKISMKLLSGRNIYLIETNRIYTKHFNASTLLFGLGYSNTSKIDNVNITKLIEIDILDIFYHTGVVGLIIVLLPFINILFILIKLTVKKKIQFNEKIVFYILMLLLVCGISCMSGHVLLDPAVSLYIAIYLIFVINELGLFKKDTIEDNKVQILSLHLGYGGGERASIDLANMLCERYNVELISLYKTVENPPFKISPKVKVIYLTELKPNREEFVKAVKSLNIFKVFYEGFKSLRILYLKYILIKHLVQNSNAKYIISSRFYFTNILNHYGRKESIKIAIEHNYNLNEKFVKKLKRNSQNIDTLVCVSKAASQIYRNYLPKLNRKVIPNRGREEEKGISKGKTKKLVSVGRLEEEKGSTDLIELMRVINEKDSKVTLDIFGDGSLREEMENKIIEYNLQDIVKIHGFKDSKYIAEFYKDASMFALVSHQESFGIVLIESMKCGVPVIAFQEATGAYELIENNKNGYIIKERNIDKMAKQIIKYLKLKDKEKILMQKNAIETSKKYSMTNIKKHWFELLSKLNQKRL